MPVLPFAKLSLPLLAHEIHTHTRHLHSGTPLSSNVSFLSGNQTQKSIELMSTLMSSQPCFPTIALCRFLLPPVIFWAGLSVEKKLFFSHLGSILTLGIAGTAVCFVITSLILWLTFSHGIGVLSLQVSAASQLLCSACLDQICLLVSDVLACSAGKSVGLGSLHRLVRLQVSAAQVWSICQSGHSWSICQSGHSQVWSTCQSGLLSEDAHIL